MVVGGRGVGGSKQTCYEQEEKNHGHMGKDINLSYYSVRGGVVMAGFALGIELRPSGIKPSTRASGEGCGLEEVGDGSQFGAEGEKNKEECTNQAGTFGTRRRTETQRESQGERKDKRGKRTTRLSKSYFDANGT